MKMNLRPTLLAATLFAVSTAPMAGGVSTTPAGQVKWLDTPFGVQAAPVVGDFQKEKHITFIKFKAGTSTPAHTHTHAYVGIVVKGRGVHYDPYNQKPTPLPAGSTWMVPAGSNHISGCLEGQDCVFALFQDEPFDYVETKK